MKSGRNSSSIAIATAFLLVALAHGLSADIKAATVNIDKLLIGYDAAKKEISALKAQRNHYLKKRNTRQKKLAELAGEIKDVYAKLKNKAMPRAERANLDKQQDQLISQYRSLSMEITNADANEVNATKRQITAACQRLLDEFQVLIHQYAKEQGYHWIIETSGTTNSKVSPLIYARNAPDITDEILAILNKKAPSQTAGDGKAAQ